MQSSSAPTNKRPIGLFALTMLAIVSVDSLRNISIAAQYGPSLLTFYAFAALAFFFPLALVTSRLASQYPVTGGSFVWIEKAFGRQFGYASVWLQWIYNMIWYPTIFVFISTTLAELTHPGLGQHKGFVLCTSLGLFWLLTAVHTIGLNAIRWLGVIGAIVGTLLPMSIMIGLGAYWTLQGHPQATPLHWHALLPDSHSLNNLAYFSNILFSLLGLEVIAMHAGNVKSPQRNYPLALLVSAIVIPISLALSSLALCMILPAGKISMVSGTMDVFRLFFDALHIRSGALFAGICVIAGGLAIASSWMLGLARGLHTALLSAGHTPWALRLNTHGIPARILVIQAVIYSILLGVFLLFDSINTSYWILSAMTSQFALLYYILLFMAALKLHRSKTGSLPGFWTTFPPILAALTCFAGLLIGFLPPEDISAGKILNYELALLIGMFVMLILPGIFIRRFREKPAV